MLLKNLPNFFRLLRHLILRHGKQLGIFPILAGFIGMFSILFKNKNVAFTEKPLKERKRQNAVWELFANFA